MGIRTVGFEKKVTRTANVPEEKLPSDVKPFKKEETSSTKKEEKVKIESCTKPVSLDESTSVTVVKKPAAPPPPPVTVFAENSGGKGSPLKLRTPTSSMARLGGIKAAARKLKKTRKRRLFVRAASNKILRNSITATKTRKSFRVESRENKPVTLPSRVSTRMCVRRSSREGIPDAPLRTVELIKRPLELREPATKLLYMASLGLYPNTGDSDMTPIVVIKELAGSPGKKNGVRKSLELPLMPFHKRILDGTHQEKRNTVEHNKVAAKPVTKPKRESQKTPPPPLKTEKQVQKKVEVKQEPAPKLSPPQTTVSQANILESISIVANDYAKATNIESLKKKSPVNGVSKSLDKSLDLTIAAGKLATYATSIVHDTGKVNPNSNSLLKSNFSPPTMSEKLEMAFPSVLNRLNAISTHNGIGKPASIPANCNVTKAMNLLMSSITIVPAPAPIINSNPTRKRRADVILPSLTTKVMEMQESSTFNGIRQIHFDEKPPRKKAKNVPEVNATRLSLPVSTVNLSKTSPPQRQNNSFAQPPPMPIQNIEEALNLCVKRSSEPLVPPVKSPPPKLQNKSIARNDTKGNVNGPRPLNLIIPRPPPLTKAPLDLANIANAASFCQNMQPIQKPKSVTKKPRKPRVNNNQRNQSTMQLPLLPPQLTSQLVAAVESTVPAKSLLKCMNGEENSCARGVGVGETLDSVKTMLARLQTSIGPAVNGVRLITIE